MRGPKLPPDEFVEAWRVASAAKQTNADLAEDLGMKPGQLARRAHYYRSRGVHLPALSRAGKPRMDVEALNRILDLSDEPT